MSTWNVWVKGALWAGVSGAAAAIAAVVLDPADFNLQKLHDIALIAAAGALAGLAGYLKQSPLEGK